MPTYLYQVIRKDGSEGELFEIEQSMSEPTLVRHPVTGEPVRKIFVAPNLVTRYGAGATKSRLENKNLERAGFTKYVRDKATGDYHRVAGREGPSTIDRKSL